MVKIVTAVTSPSRRPLQLVLARVHSERTRENGRLLINALFIFALGRNVRGVETAEVLFEYGADLIALPKPPLHIAAILTVCISVRVTDLSTPEICSLYTLQSFAHRSDQRTVTQALDWLRAFPIERAP